MLHSPCWDAFIFFSFISYLCFITMFLPLSWLSLFSPPFLILLKLGLFLFSPCVLILPLLLIFSPFVNEWQRVTQSHKISNMSLKWSRVVLIWASHDSFRWVRDTISLYKSSSCMSKLSMESIGGCTMWTSTSLTWSFIIPTRGDKKYCNSSNWIPFYLLLLVVD